MENKALLKDIRLKLSHHELRPVYGVDTDERAISTKPGLFTDIGAISGQDNLAQAIIMRLLTPMGELAGLGHPEYGARLHELIGMPNTETKRNLAKLYILESLKQEPRVAKVAEVSVKPITGLRDAVDILLRVIPIGQTHSVTIGPFTLELG